MVSQPTLLSASLEDSSSSEWVVALSGLLPGTTKLRVNAWGGFGGVVQVVVTDRNAAERTFSHRIAGALAPENSMSAIRFAASTGVTGVEFDVRLTSDLVPILIHDDDFSRVAKVSASVSGTTFADSRRFNVAAYFRPAQPPEPAPTLTEALRLLQASPVKLIFAEIKHDARFSPDTEAAAVLAAVHESGIDDRLILYSTQTSIISRLRARSATQRLALVAPYRIDAHANFAEQQRLEFLVFPMDSLLTSNFAPFEALMQRGIKLAGYTATRTDELQSFFARRPDVWVFSDSAPGLFRPARRD